MKNKGITLVALVITIIILLILAGISISALTNQGLFTQAQNAKNLTEEKTAEENEILTNYLEQMNAILGGQVTESIPDGATVTPINDITTWLKTGGISKQYSYTTIEQVIADTTCTESLMNNENAMKYLARSTEFTDAICASETTMTYLGQSAYVDDTVLNNNLWVEKIKSSSYWNKIYNQQFTIYGGAYETITISGYSGSFTTNADGSVTHELPLGTITLIGSVSGQSFTRTITNETTEVYVMPDGFILYWYGAFPNGKSVLNNKTLSNGHRFCAISSATKIDGTSYSKIYISGLSTASTSYSQPRLSATFLDILAENATERTQLSTSYTVSKEISSNVITNIELDVPSFTGEKYLALVNGSTSNDSATVKLNTNSIEIKIVNINNSGCTFAGTYNYCYLK